MVVSVETLVSPKSGKLALQERTSLPQVTIMTFGVPAGFYVPIIGVEGPDTALPLSRLSLPYIV